MVKVAESTFSDVDVILWLVEPTTYILSLIHIYYINMSIFLACAASIPDVQVLLMFIFPIKVKSVSYTHLDVYKRQLVIGVFGVKKAEALMMFCCHDDIFHAGRFCLSCPFFRVVQILSLIHI